MRRVRGIRFIIILLVLVVIALIWKLELFNINKVSVVTNNVSCTTEEIVKNELDLVGKNIFLINEINLGEKIIAKFPCIKGISLEKKLLKEVEVKAEGRVGIIRAVSFKENNTVNLLNFESTPSSQAALINWSQPVLGNEFLVDSEGILFALRQEENLPVVFWPEEGFKIGKKLKSSIFYKVKEVLANLGTFELGKFGTSTSLKVTDNNLLVDVGEKIVFSLQKDISRQLASLQLILQKAKIEGKSIESIDLRFDKPIVIYESRK